MLRTSLCMRPTLPLMQMPMRCFSEKAEAPKPEEMHGFARLTKHYKERKAMAKTIPDIEAEMTFNHLPYGIRFFMFINRIRFRIFVILSLGALFNYWGNLMGIASSKVERTFKKYKRRWIYRYNRAAMTYPTALETLYEPMKLSRQSTDKLS